MNRIAIKVAIGSFALLLTSAALAADGFTQSCRDIDLRRGSVLEAVCRSASGRPSRDRLNLNDYIGVVNGDLRWERNGNFSDRTRNCALDRYRGDTILRCDTQRRHGSWTSSSLNLDERITNINGTLQYRGRRR
jgi:hypothetical protein